MGVPEADAFAKAHEWGAAAVEYAAAAARANNDGDRPASRRLWEAAGECWRRDDRPQHAVEALRNSLAATPEGPQAAVVRLKLAGVLGEIGQGAIVLEVLRDAATALPSGALHVMALDATFEALVGLGRRDDAAAVLVDLDRLVRGESEPALMMSASFRGGQLARLSGMLDEAAAKFGAVIAAVEDYPEALPARAAAEAELAEVAALRGDTAESLALWDQARSHFAAIGRRALDWRAEAGRVRAAVDVGAFVFTTDLDEGVRTAEQRGMVVLEADLRLARGLARVTVDRAGARQDIERAIALAEAHGLRWRAGRGRLELARRLLQGAEQRALAERAASELAGNDPWHWRAVAVYAQGVELARCLARFEAMGMERDAELARSRVMP